MVGKQSGLVILPEHLRAYVVPCTIYNHILLRRDMVWPIIAAMTIFV